MALLSFAIASAIPSFSANQARVEDERVWAELGISVLGTHSGALERMTASHPLRKFGSEFLNDGS